MYDVYFFGPMDLSVSFSKDHIMDYPMDQFMDWIIYWPMDQPMCQPMNHTKLGPRIIPWLGIGWTMN